MKLVERITNLEEQTRDKVQGPLTAAVIPRWVKPNHITGLRILLSFMAVGLFIADRPLQQQAWTLVAAALTDSIDGTLARVRGQSSRLGAYLDQASDWLLGAWTGVLVLLHGLLPVNLIILIVIPQVGITLSDRILAAGLGGKTLGDRVLTTVMGPANFRPSTFTRLQFFTVLLGFFLLLFSHITGQPGMRRLGIASLYAEVVLAWLLLADSTIKLTGKRPT